MQPMSPACQRAFDRSLKSHFLTADIRGEMLIKRATSPPASKPKVSTKKTKRQPAKAKAMVKSKQNEVGLLIVIQDQLRRDTPCFIGWCENGGVSALLDRVQFGSPLPLAVTGFFTTMRRDRTWHYKALKSSRTTTDNSNWYDMTKHVAKYLAALRTEFDETETDGNVT